MALVDSFLKFNEGEHPKEKACKCGQPHPLHGSQFFNNSVSYHLNAYIPKKVKEYAWQPPPQGWVKLNVDGSYLGNSGLASAGGLLRDASSNWLCGFGFNIGESSILHAEIIGISYGLQFAWNMGFRRVIAESDSLTAIKLITQEQNISFHPLAHLIEDCRKLLSLDWYCSLFHIYRERNFSADALAKKSHGLEFEEFTIWDSPPWKVVPFLNKDKLGIAFKRH